MADDPRLRSRLYRLASDVQPDVDDRLARTVGAVQRRARSRRLATEAIATIALVVVIGTGLGAYAFFTRPSPISPADQTSPQPTATSASVAQSPGPTASASTPTDVTANGSGPWVAFNRNGYPGTYSQRNRLWAMRADGSSAHEIYDRASSVAWSRDGTRLLMSAGSIVVAQVGDDIGPFLETGIADPADSQWEAFDFAPDGKRVVYVQKSKCAGSSSPSGSQPFAVVLAVMVAETPGPNCYVLGLLDLHTRELTELGETLVKDQVPTQNMALELPAWSNDGTQIAYSVLDQNVERGQLWIVNADGTNPHKVELSEDVSVQEPRWSPDDKRISFSTLLGVYVVDLGTGHVEPVVYPGNPITHRLCCAEWIDNSTLRVQEGGLGDSFRFWDVTTGTTAPAPQLLADLTDSLAAIDPPGDVTTITAPGDPGRSFFWQPGPFGQ